MPIALRVPKEPIPYPDYDRNLALSLGRAFALGGIILVLSGIAFLIAVAVIGWRVLT
jgi:hypothetical protein